jgi:predicted metal-binding membrane protein
MTNTTTDRARRTTERIDTGVSTGPRWAAPRVALMVVAAGAWGVTILWARATGNGPGTMGLDLGRFVAMWALMMTAMMLPSVVAVARPSEPATSEQTTSERRSAGGRHDSGETFVFASGYLLVWAATGLPAFGVAVVAGRLADHHPAVATAGAVALFALTGLYQFTATKRRSLEHCRGPLALGGTFPAALRKGAQYCGWCLACSWGAMALMIALGVMNIAAMVVLALVIFAERFVFPGKLFSRLAGGAALAFGALVIASPSLATGLSQMPSMPHMPHM